MVIVKDGKSVRSPRLSLQVQPNTGEFSELPESPLRHTLSQNDGSKRRKKYAPRAPPTIIEVEGVHSSTAAKSDTFVKAASRGSKRGSTRDSTRKAQHAYDNSGFDNESTSGRVSNVSIPIPFDAIDRNASIRTSSRSLS